MVSKFMTIVNKNEVWLDYRALYIKYYRSGQLAIIQEILDSLNEVIDNADIDNENNEDNKEDEF